MWLLKEPKPAKLIVGILAADAACLETAANELTGVFGRADVISDVWPFDKTSYYTDETGENIVRQFISFDKLVNPGDLAKIKHQTNSLEQQLADRLHTQVQRPVNLDPGLIEPSKLVLATTKNYSHRIYIGDKIYAEVTLIYDKKRWRPLEHTYPDYRLQCYHDFFEKVRVRLLEQLKA